MVLFAPISWNTFANTHLTSTFVFSMRFRAQDILKALLLFWSQSVFWSLLKRRGIASPSNPILPRAPIIDLNRSFVGVTAKRNCKDSLDCDIVTKKNTSICRRSVLDLVCYTGSLVIPNIAHREKEINFFTGLYV